MKPAVSERSRTDNDCKQPEEDRQLGKGKKSDSMPSQTASELNFGWDGGQECPPHTKTKSPQHKLTAKT